MERIVVIGCGGSGKTTLARRLGAALGAPVIHLDALYYDKEWQALPMEEFAALQKRVVAGPRWVIDGNFASTLPIRLARATTVVFLDLSAPACLWGIVRCRIAHGGGRHGAIGVYDRITWGFLKYVWNYRRTMRPRVRELIAEHGAHADVHVVDSRRGADRFLAR